MPSPGSLKATTVAVHALHALGDGLHEVRVNRPAEAILHPLDEGRDNGILARPIWIAIVTLIDDAAASAAWTGSATSKSISATHAGRTSSG